MGYTIKLCLLFRQLLGCRVRLHSLVDANDPSINWTDVLDVVEAINAQEDESKHSDEQEQEEGDEDGHVSDLGANQGGDDIPAVGTLEIADWVLSPIGHIRSNSRSHHRYLKWK